MLNRIKRSASYRLPWLYKKILAQLPIERFPLAERSGEHFVTMCGAGHLSMLVECLFSAACRWSAVPRLTIYLDGTCQPEDVSRLLSWWPGRIEIGSIASALAWADLNGYRYLRKYAKKDGFGKKLLVLAKESSVGRIVWFDADMLFFDDVKRLLDKTRAEDSGVFTARDWCEGYDQSLVGVGQPLHYLKQLPLVNTGFLVAASPVYNPALESLVLHALPSCNGFTEQTLLAKVVYDTGRIAWALGEIDISDGDKFVVNPGSRVGNGSVIRHYVTPIRHMFWRDALFNRLRRARARA